MTATVQESGYMSLWPRQWRMKRWSFKKRLLLSIRPPPLDCLCNKSGSTFPSPGLKCPIWARVLALVLGKDVKVQVRVAGSVQSLRSIVWWGEGLGAVRAGRPGGGGAQDGPRFWWGWQTPSGCWCLLPVGQPAAFSSSDGGGRGWRHRRHSCTLLLRPRCPPEWCRSWYHDVSGQTWLLQTQKMK